MSQADKIRETALKRYVQPARMAGHQEITIRAGDLHSLMKLSNAMPAVCSALRSGKFEQLASVRQVQIMGPAAGANVYFRFDLTGQVDVSEQAISRPRAEVPHPAREAAVPASDLVDLKDALVLVSCVKSKLPYPTLPCPGPPALLLGPIQEGATLSGG